MINMIMKKKTFLVTMIILTMLFVSGSVTQIKADDNYHYYLEDDYDDIYYGSDSKEYVYDYANILTDAEEKKLADKCRAASEDCECDIVIVTTRIGHDYGTMDKWLSDFLTSNGYSSDAIIYGVDMVSRADRIYTRGKAQTDISQRKLDSIRESCENDFKDDDYYDGYNKFVKRIDRCLTTNIWKKLTYDWGIKLLISVAVAVISVLIMMRNAKARMTVSSTEYTKNHQFKVNAERDVFINTTVVKRQIQSSSRGHGGGGGGNHGSGGHF